MTNFIEASILDLVRWTQFVHDVKPSFKNKLVYGIEELKPGDRNIKFHLMNRVKETEYEEDEETDVFMLSAEYILEYYGELTDDANNLRKAEEKSS